MVVLGSMLVSVLVNVAGLSDEHCTSSGCREARALLPWLVTLGTLLVVLVLARMFGPVFASPAVSSWLLSTPADRGALLRPRVWSAATIAALVTGFLAAAATTLGGFGAPAIAAYSVLAAVLAVLMVALAVLGQGGRGRAVQFLVWALAAVLWSVLVLLSVGRAPLLDAPDEASGPVLAVGAGLVIATGCLVVMALRSTGRLHRRDIAAGGNLAPGLSGALASLDLALMYDVLLGHRWRGKGSVPSRRGGPAGASALVRKDLVRLARSPQWLVLVAASVVLPYAVGVAGGERVAFLAAALVGFLTGLPLLSALRVLVRSPSVLRHFPFPVARARQATLVVPAIVLLLHGIAITPLLHRVLELNWSAALVCAIASGLASLAASTRWVTGKPPDFGRPLVSSPAGGVPTNLYGSALRGFDILLLTTLPVLLVPSGAAALVSIGISLVVLVVLADS
ncbi:DUF6297 family protein [Nocardioides sp. AE5]|uniref:DUF6297 family protein n=1 Tax=Nocardioides sp. AE5 TaxID=2962573 RepID=UPI002882BA37|nr:DUF6297 family protein [Nocardioides sp. AE5]MDT0203382.1 DUF6297 family protein [Nocardioides sp. AE5]